MQVSSTVTPAELLKPIDRVFDIASKKVASLDKLWDTSKGTPVFTIDGQYASRGWTEWTEGFKYGCAILAFDHTGDKKLLEIGRRRTVERMAGHVTHIGVHDHGFNNLSTYGNLRRLMREKKIPANEWENHFYELAIKASGAVQAARWSGTGPTPDMKHTARATGLGYVYSFNGPHSLFVDTMRTIRVMGVAWQLGHKLMHENDKAADLLKRSVLHGLTTSQFIVCHGDTEHTYDVRGRTSHESIFNRVDGRFRCRSTQQGYSPFSTWTRGLAWAMLGYAEELEFFKSIDAKAFEHSVGMKKADVVKEYEAAARATCDHYIDDVSCVDGITYWDDGAPGLARLGDWKSRTADLQQDEEPVDASASAIAAQGLIRLGNYLGKTAGKRYLQAGLTVAQTLTAEPYLSTSPKHQGLLLHSVYHRPNNWDYIPKGRRVPVGESSMWGDYHLLELSLLVSRMARGEYVTFYDV